MRTVLTLLTVLTICASAWGQAFSIFDPAMQAETVASAAPTYLVSEDCEGTGTPSGWTDTGTVDWDSTNAIDGTNVLAINISTLSSSYVDFSPASHLFFASARSVVNSSPPRVRTRLMNGSTVIGTLTWSTTAVTLTHGAQPVTVSISTASGNWRYLWIDYAPATGAGNDGVLSITVSATQNKLDGVTNTILNGTASSQLTRLWLGDISTASQILYFDKIRISTTEIGSNPP